MKNRLRAIAILTLLCGLAAAGFGAWSYFHSRAQDESWRKLQERYIELDDRADTVKGTPEEDRLLAESQKYEREAADALASAKSSSRLALILGIASMVLILISVALMVAHQKKEMDSP